MRAISTTCKRRTALLHTPPQSHGSRAHKLNALLTALLCVYRAGAAGIYKRSPHAPSNNNTNISNCYRKHENEKKRAYEQRIRDVEHASFTPLVFSATGGMAKQSTTFYKRLASLLADKWDHTYSKTLYWLHCRLSFSLLRSAIQCIRGARSSCGHAIHSSSPIDLVSTEAHFSQQ